jgi:hypothetical protein
MNKYWQKWLALVSKANSLGIPVPTIRDPKTGLGSVSLTLVFVSSLFVIAGIVGKWSAKFGDIDMASAFQFFWTAVSLYWGRKFQSKDVKFTDSVSEEGELPAPAANKSTAASQKPDNPDA